MERERAVAEAKRIEEESRLREQQERAKREEAERKAEEARLEAKRQQEEKERQEKEAAELKLQAKAEEVSALYGRELDQYKDLVHGWVWHVDVCMCVYVYVDMLFERAFSEWLFCFHRNE